MAELFSSNTCRHHRHKAGKISFAFRHDPNQFPAMPRQIEVKGLACQVGGGCDLLKS